MIIWLHLTIVLIAIKLFGLAIQIIGRLNHNFVIYNKINVMYKCINFKEWLVKFFIAILQPRSQGVFPFLYLTGSTFTR